VALMGGPADVLHHLLGRRPRPGFAVADRRLCPNQSSPTSRAAPEILPPSSHPLCLRSPAAGHKTAAGPQNTKPRCARSSFRSRTQMPRII
jgi:hypothetical protein